MEAPLVSVIITCYNQAHCIARTLESVKLQTYINWECIIVDDGSTDDSADFIKKTIGFDGRFRYIYQANSGVASARNTGFAMIKGAYINFLDGDDTFLPNKLQRQMQVFKEQPDVAICICDHQHYNVKIDKISHYKFEKISRKPLKQILYNWQKGTAFPPHAALYKRNIWLENEWPFPVDYLYRSEDWVFNIFVALKQEPYYFLDEILCTYHHDDNNYTSEVYNSTSSTIYAAFYIQPLLPKQFQSDFLEHTIKKSMNRYVESQKVAILHNSGNWRLGNFLTKPIFWLKNKIKKIS